jgi:hypothetical protein
VEAWWKQQRPTKEKNDDELTTTFLQKAILSSTPSPHQYIDDVDQFCPVSL